jgi:cytochrome c-type biogenesis protein CcmH
VRDRLALAFLVLALTSLAKVQAAPERSTQVAPTASRSSVGATGADASTLDERVNQLASELRCLVCQNQTVADSHAPLAVQLKQEVRKQLAAGASADEVRDFMVQRYGDFVLYRPPVKAGTLALWLGPAVILLGGLVTLALVLRQRRPRDDDPFDERDDQRTA